jgi:hypothetical protein
VRKEIEWEEKVEIDTREADEGWEKVNRTEDEREHESEDVGEVGGRGEELAEASPNEQTTTSHPSYQVLDVGRSLIQFGTRIADCG